jgi:hypothetical protein
MAAKLLDVPSASGNSGDLGDPKNPANSQLSGASMLLPPTSARADAARSLGVGPSVGCGVASRMCQSRCQSR